MQTEGSISNIDESLLEKRQIPKGMTSEQAQIQHKYRNYGELRRVKPAAV
jgi:hypothetical protein